MGKCCSKQNSQPKKQNKDMDDKRMFKVGLDIMNKEFCIEAGYNRRAKKKYTDAVYVDHTVHQSLPNNEGKGSEDNETENDQEI